MNRARPFGRRRLRLLIAALLAVLCAVLIPVLFRPPAASPPPSAALLAAAEGLDEMAIEASFSPETRTLEVAQTLTLRSRAPQERRELVLRAYPNAFQRADTSPCASESGGDCYPDGFSAGALVMSQATAAVGQTPAADVLYRYTDEAKTVLSLPLPHAWQTGQTLVVTLRYTVTVPRAAYRFGVNGGFFALGNALIVPAVWENGAYRADAYGALGDPFVSDAANYRVTLTLPAGYVCAGTAYPAAEPSGDQTVYRFTAPAAREFALAVSERYQVRQAMEGDVLVSAYASDGAKAAEALRYAQSALRVFNGRFGAYPYPSLTLAEIDAPFDGMEYPGFVMIGSKALQTGGETLEIAVAHETAHQWWYAAVGSDPVLQPWQDEALATFSVLGYLAAVRGDASRDAYYESTIAPAMRLTFPRGVTPGAPLSYFSSPSEYVALVYGRGAAMLCALDTMMSGGLDGFLSVYYDRYAFSRVTREDFLALLWQHTGEDYEPLIADYLDTYIIP